MTTDYLRAFVIPAAYAVLPPVMASPEATALVLAIGWQESRFTSRQQRGGPARGLWQFETTGVTGVLAHQKSAEAARGALKALEYPHTPTPFGCYDAIGHNDVLAACFARLLLWTLPGPLPTREQREIGWTQYVAAWRPGKPRHESWGQAWAVAWTA